VEFLVFEITDKVWTDGVLDVHVCSLCVTKMSLEHVHSAAVGVHVIEGFPKCWEGFTVRQPTPTVHVGEFNSGESRGLIWDGHLQCWSHGGAVILILFLEGGGNRS